MKTAINMKPTKTYLHVVDELAKANELIGFSLSDQLYPVGQGEQEPDHQPGVC